MTENTIQLLDKICNTDNPEQALLVAIKVVTDFLNRPEASESKSSVESPEHA